jgi:predicted DCC family thiol-disulfide oxidoreductase YuxK
MDARSLVLFDGVCNVCNHAVLFVIDRDPNERFVFAPLSSALGERTLREHGITPGSLDSIVLVEGGRAYTHSDAALRIAAGLARPWSWLSALGRLVPRALRDLAYRAFAARRYRWFGRQESCRVPTPELRRRFLA